MLKRLRKDKEKMKIIGVDNYDREMYGDVLVCENVKNDYYANKIVDVLNYGRKLSDEERNNISFINSISLISDTFYKIVDDNYELFDPFEQKGQQTMNIQREMTISTLEEMCELMCGGVEEEFYDENNEVLFKSGTLIIDYINKEEK